MLNNSWNNSLWFVPMAAIVAPAYAVDYLSVAQAQKSIFSAEASFIEYPLVLSKQEKKQIKALAGVRQRQDKQPIWRVMQNGQPAGWFMVDDVVGKHEYITYGVGIDNTGEVISIEIMSYRETHGGQVREQSWRQRFEGKTLADPFKLDKDIPNISGATLSCRNLTDGVKRLLALHEVMLKGKTL